MTKTGINAVPGFRANGVHCGLKRKRRDMALIVSDRVTSAAAVFTQNAFAAAPVLLSKRRIKAGDVRAIVVNSGNANACTGTRGAKDAEEMTVLAARALGLKPEQVMVASTGIIGRPLDMEKIRTGITECAGGLDTATGDEVAEAITTTDAYTKQAERSVEVEGRTFHVAGIAKGAGMIHPNMATMLGFVVTDAPVAEDHFQALLAETVDETFNMISVDGDESTNDMVAAFANGAEGGALVAPGTPEWHALSDAFRAVCTDLAKMIPTDGEGATHLIEVVVEGAASVADARAAARAVSSSNLVKAAVYGGDPNWGRIVAALGQTEVAIDPASVSITFDGAEGGATVLDKGEPTGALKDAARAFATKEMRIRIDLASGDASATAWGSDLTEAYVRFNSAYST
ncbi:MAG: bifunctional glutamate N-acetyltransferase/amino-acid acetyltransferase ArgJ [Euryarchaeota archaeon]|nr:bifunctional glutamate N-acetyltransferase/amino-acid acetyltransferase ArgJ [Euryarchaeota archaeon]